MNWAMHNNDSNKNSCVYLKSQKLETGNKVDKMLKIHTLELGTETGLQPKAGPKLCLMVISAKWSPTVSLRKALPCGCAVVAGEARCPSWDVQPLCSSGPVLEREGEDRGEFIFLSYLSFFL